MNVRDAPNSDICSMLNSELPAFWPILVSICKYENSNDFLPQDVAKLVNQLLDIRRDTFLRATQRYVEDYIKWDKGNTDHSTQMYPTFEIMTYPNK